MKIEIPLETAEWIKDYLFDLLAAWVWKKSSIPRYREEYEELEKITLDFARMVKNKRR